MMLTRNTLSWLCPILASLCLGAGLLSAGLGAAAAGGAGPLLFWLASRRWPAFSTITLALVVSAAAAAYGVAVGAAAGPNSLWMVLGISLALAGWDLALLDHQLARNPPDLPTARLETAHLAALGLALGAGLLVVLLGRMIRLQIPFALMVALVVLAYFSLERLVRSLKG